MIQEYKIKFLWDDEAEVWVATSNEVYGLVLEDESFDALVKRVRFAVPELLAFENNLNGDISLDFAISRKERLVFSG